LSSGYHSSVAWIFQVITVVLLEEFSLSQQCCLKSSGYQSSVA